MLRKLYENILETKAYRATEETFKKLQDVKHQSGNEGDKVDAPWKHLIGGAMAGAVSRTATAPLDRLKVMAQVTGKKINPIEGIKMMYKEGGMVSMWRGNGINVLKIVPENAVKFFMFNELKKFYLRDKPNGTLNGTDRIMSAGIAGVLAHIVIFPMEVVKTRMVMQNSKTRSSIFKTLVEGLKLNGYQLLIKGFVPSHLGIFAFCAADLTSYETMKRIYLEKYSKEDISIPTIVMFGSLSAVIGNIFSYPLSMVATYLQFADHPGISTWQAATKFLYKRWKDYGIIGLYKGAALASLKTVPSIAITYAVYEQVLYILKTKMT